AGRAAARRREDPPQPPAGRGHRARAGGQPCGSRIRCPAARREPRPVGGLLRRRRRGRGRSYFALGRLSAAIDTERNCVIVFTNLRRASRDRGDLGMHEREWMGPVAGTAGLLVLRGPCLAWAAAEGGHESGGLISLDKSLIVQFLNFIILLLILQRLLYKPFLAKMAERT